MDEIVTAVPDDIVIHVIHDNYPQAKMKSGWHIIRIFTSALCQLMSVGLSRREFCSEYLAK
jgi:hypothetical protein